jgi:hypothetical protein
MKPQKKPQHNYFSMSTSLYDVQQQFLLIDIYEKVKAESQKR